MLVAKLLRTTSHILRTYELLLKSNQSLRTRGKEHHLVYQNQRKNNIELIFTCTLYSSRPVENEGTRIMGHGPLLIQ